jgi:tetratricopeptide (TPR) repeat protein
MLGIPARGGTAKGQHGGYHPADAHGIECPDTLWLEIHIYQSFSFSFTPHLLAALHEIFVASRKLQEVHWINRSLKPTREAFRATEFMETPMRIPAFILASALIASPAGAATFGDAIAHYSLQQYDKALAEWRELAQTGDAPSEYYLGLLYETGRGVNENIDTAISWYEKAAAAGHAEAAYRLARLARQGGHLTADAQQILGWVRQAAEGGVADAQYEMGAYLAEGKLVPRDLKAALSWFEKAESGLEGTPKAAQAERMRALIASKIAADTKAPTVQASVSE